WRRGTAWDSSESAYAAALYWRAEMPDGEIRTSLVLAKARVAPLKLTSIPRLELQTDVMGSRIAAAVTGKHYRKPDTSVLDRQRHHRREQHCGGMALGPHEGKCRRRRHKGDTRRL
ncbi:hypothetical protein F3G61_31110, partial [Pseudomonas aeruginosa]